MNWRPLKTAPRDKLILLSYRNGEDSFVGMGRWIDVHHTNHVLGLLQKSQSIPPVTDYGWEIAYVAIMDMGGGFNGLTWEARSFRVEPTHWQPLPKPHNQL